MEIRINKFIEDKEYPRCLGAHLYRLNDNHFKCYPNPLNIERYIVIIGTNNLDYFQLCEKDLSLKSWYDFSIWKHYGSNRYRLLDAGYFDLFWH